MRFEIEQFIDWIRMRSPQARTWRDYKCDMELFVTTVRDRNPEEIQPRDIDGFVNDQTRKGYKPSTVNRRLAAVVSFYKFLIADGRPIRCPVLPKRHYLREPQRLPRPVSEQELRKYFGAISDVRDRAMFTLMLKCGLRIGEVSALKLTDLYLGEAPSRMIIRGKGSRERTVFLTSEAEKCLQEWIRKRPVARDEHVFLSYQLRKLSTTSITTRINHVRKVSGVDLTAHRLRHSFADHLLSAGMPITSIQKLLGHRFIETTQNYAVANDKQVQVDFYRACEKLEGWKLLLESVDLPNTEIGSNTVDVQDQNPTDKGNQTFFLLPAPLSFLPLELIRQLDAYRRIKANRWREERVAANSILFYSQHGILWKFFQETCEVKSASELHLDHVLHFIKARLDTGRSASTVNGSLSSLRSFLNFLKEDDVPVHPSLENIQRLKETERLPRYMTAEQISRLNNEIEVHVSSADNHVKQYDGLLIRAVFYLLWQGGLRSGEVELLRFSDFYISKSNEAKRLFIRDGKWRKGRSVYLTDVALKALRDYFAIRGVEKVCDFVFVRNGMPLKKSFIARRLKAIGRQVEVNVSPHRLRHTFATQLLNVGCRVTSIQKLLGHTNLNTTMTYARAFDRTVMLDYFQAVDSMESQPDGLWFDLNEDLVPK